VVSRAEEGAIAAAQPGIAPSAVTQSTPAALSARTGVDVHGGFHDRGPFEVSDLALPDIEVHEVTPGAGQCGLD